MLYAHMLVTSSEIILTGVMCLCLDTTGNFEKVTCSKKEVVSKE